jgi:alkylation response protein AidB-like acyl-CoA dehydrogenase
MKFELDDEHYEYSQVLSEALDKMDSVAVARSLADGDDEGLDGLLGRLADLGVSGLCVQDHYGGSGLEPTDCVLAVEQLGRSLAPDMVAETLAVAVPVLQRHADDSLKADLLPSLAAGSSWVTVQDGWGGTAPWGAAADLVAVVADDALYLTAPGPGDVTAIEGVDATRRPGRVSRSAPVLARLDREAADETRLRATGVAAMLLCGVADRMVAVASRYAADRKQFGVPVGSFQGVKHLLADAFTSVEFARRSAWWASLALDIGSSDAIEAVSIAKATLSEAASEASYASMQAFGGMGYTWDCPIHLWMRRAQVLASGWGNADEHWRRLREPTMGVR